MTKNTDKKKPERWSNRSGRVVSYRVGEEKPPLPPPPVRRKKQVDPKPYEPPPVYSDEARAEALRVIRAHYQSYVKAMKK